MLFKLQQRVKMLYIIKDESIEEVNEYTYLGYFVNRTLKSNFHICNFLKEKADKQLNYMIRVLEEHGDFNVYKITKIFVFVYLLNWFIP
jgi:hypothetical protein